MIPEPTNILRFVKALAEYKMKPKGQPITPKKKKRVKRKRTHRG